MRSIGWVAFVIASLGGEALAQQYDIVIDTDQTAPVVLSGPGGSALVEQGVTIQPITPPAGSALGGNGAIDWSVTNNGTIYQALGNGIELKGVTTINRSIYGNPQAILSGTNNPLYPQLHSLVLTNSGGALISSARYGVFHYGNMSITNYGSIHGDEVALYTYGGAPGGQITSKVVYNYGVLSS